MRAMSSDKPDKKSPFAALEAMKAALPAGEPPRAASKPEVVAKDEFEAKVVIARSRKGRGGKTVSTITGVKASAREAICRDLKKALGCGATIEDDAIVVLGDVADRARVWIEARGARRIVMGS
jgi:translation initiation factor 1 (eIF-1/SUI1)